MGARVFPRAPSAGGALLLPSLAARMPRRTLATAMAAEGQEAIDFDNTRLYPQPSLNADGMLAVSDLHTIAW